MDMVPGIALKTVLNILFFARYNLGAAHTEGKERFAAKEREEAVKKARERRKEDMRAKDLLRRELEADKRYLWLF